MCIRDSVWTSEDTAQAKKRMKKEAAKAAPSAAAKSRLVLRDVVGARKSKMPSDLPRPMLPTASREAPKGEQWLHEIKYDGYRMLCAIEKGKARFVSRNGNDWTSKVPRLAKRVAKLDVQNAVLDGEVVAMAADGTTDFQALQNTIGRGQDAALRYYVFDLLHLDDHDLSGVALEKRKQILEPLLPTDENDSLHFSEHIRGNGPTVFQHACRLGTEGIVSKKAGGKYVAGRTLDWLKTKSLLSAEFVVGGFTASTTSRFGFGSLVLGAYDGDDLVYLGRVGTGFTDRSRETITELLSNCKREVNPFVNVEARDFERRVYWLEPIHLSLIHI